MPKHCDICHRTKVKVCESCGLCPVGHCILEKDLKVPELQLQEQPIETTTDKYEHSPWWFLPPEERS